jgi:hypothetical protein
MPEIQVREVGPPPYFTGKNMPKLCLARVRNSTGLHPTPSQDHFQTLREEFPLGNLFSIIYHYAIAHVSILCLITSTNFSFVMCLADM